MMRAITLDTNCLIALENGEETAPHLRKLIAAHKEGRIDLAIPAIAASERQQGGGYLETFGQFEQRLANLELSDVRLIEPIAYYGISFYGRGLWANETMVDLERQIQNILHPDIEFTLAEYCVARGLEIDTVSPDKKWRNAKCDVQAMWSHIWFNREIFVSSDRNFSKRTKASQLSGLGAGQILVPQSAAETV